jgi:outer membrane immunogenic protein
MAISLRWGTAMKKLATTIAAIALIGTPAFAADMAVKAPPPAPPAPVPYTWTGFYVGGNVGASFGTFKTDFNAPVTFAAALGAQSGTATIPLAGSDELYPGGFVGGAQIGYNWQLSPIWAVGLEADFQGIDNKGGTTFTSNFTGVPLDGVRDVSGSTVFDYQTKIDWFGTVRLRAGYVWGDGNVFSYVTGGLAYGKVDVEGTSTVNGTVPGISPTSGPLQVSATQAFGHSQVNTGWVVGSGTEGKLLIPGWTYKIEALYMDLGHLDATGSGAAFGTLGGLTLSATAPVTTHSHFIDGILRAGLNYQFH